MSAEQFAVLGDFVRDRAGITIVSKMKLIKFNKWFLAVFPEFRGSRVVNFFFAAPSYSSAGLLRLRVLKYHGAIVL
jgi:hypothetical protein